MGLELQVAVSSHLGPGNSPGASGNTEGIFNPSHLSSPLADFLPSMQEALGSIPNTKQMRCGGVHLSPQQ